MSKASISAIILTHNEEKNLERVIKSVSFCDEIIIFDHFSSDKTEAISKKFQVKFYQRDLNDDFSAQRNAAMKKTRGEWLLFVDADEEVTEELKKEIVSLLHCSIANKYQCSAFYIKRRDFWWGRELKYGEVKKAREQGMIRLMKKNSGQWIGKIHERFETFGPTGWLQHFLNHYPHPTIKDFLKEINYYSTLRAKELLSQSKTISLCEIVTYPLFKFVFNYFISLGFLDGAHGFIYAFFMSFHSFLVRTKLYQYNHHKPKNGR